MKKQTILSIVKWIFVVLILFFMWKRIGASWDQIKSYDFSFNVFFMMLSLICVVFGFFLLSVGWEEILKRMKIGLPRKKVYSIWSKGLLFKYIPGLVWIALSKAYLFEKEGIKKRDTVLSVTVEHFFILLAAIIVSLFYILTRFSNSKQFSVYIPVVIVGIVLLHPKVFNWGLSLVTKLFKQKKLEFSSVDIIKTMSIYLLAWIVIGVGFAFFVQSMISISASFLLLTSLFSLSWSAGFVILVVPGGLGVREGVLTLALGEFIDPSVALIVAFSARLWWVVGELFSYIISSVVKRFL